MGRCLLSVGRILMAGVAAGGVLSEEFRPAGMLIRVPAVVEGRCAGLAHLLTQQSFVLFIFSMLVVQ